MLGLCAEIKPREKKKPLKFQMVFDKHRERSSTYQINSESADPLPYKFLTSLWGKKTSENTEKKQNLAFFNVFYISKCLIF